MKTSIVKAMQLEHHLALATMRGGQGTLYTASSLMRVVYMLYFLYDEAPDDALLAHLREVERLFAACIREAQVTQTYCIDGQAFPLLEVILQAFDRELESVTKHRFTQTWGRVVREMEKSGESLFHFSAGFDSIFDVSPVGQAVDRTAPDPSRDR